MSELQLDNPMIGLNAFYAAALERGYAVAMWRQPGAAHPLALATPSAHYTERVRMAESRPGFVFAPFAEDQPSLFMPAHHLLDNQGLHTAAGQIPLSLSPAPLNHLAQGGPRWHLAPDAPHSALAAPAFKQLVADAIHFIRTAHIAKVVVSRTAPVQLPPDFDPVALFAVLCRRYPNAFVSLVTIPGAGAWLGASPELLLRTCGQALSTVALAGTRPLPANDSLASVLWGAKEQDEQEMVSAYIRTVFDDAGAQHVVEEGPTTVIAGGMVHLQTRFTVEDDEGADPALADNILDRLHPTSAVCGMPRNEALQFIQAREGYDRGFYSGYLGPVNIAGASTLYVNLRCMQVRTTSAALFVGAGITAKSDPAAEWRETELKARTILDAIAETESVTATNSHTVGIDAQRTPQPA